jgi:integrase
MLQPTAPIDSVSTAFLLVETTRRGEPVWAVKWRREDGSRVKRRLGAAAWLESDGAGRWRPREGRPRPEHLTERQARRTTATVVRAAEAQAAEDRLRAAHAHDAAERAAGPRFRTLAHTWLKHLAAVADVKPSTLRNYRALLAEPGTPHRRGPGHALGRIIGALGDKPPAEVTTADVATLLDDVAAGGVSRRTVNRHREVVVAIFNFGLRPEQRDHWQIQENPAAATSKRREDGPARLEVFTVEQVEALARSAAAGTWRTARGYATPASEATRRDEDQQLAELLRIAAYTGLRRGELVALRWRDVRWGERVLVVERALSDTVERTTKGRRVRYVPLGDQALGALDRLSQRPNFTGSEEYVFCSTVGDRLDPSALRRRYIAARDAVGLPKLRFHDLRHTAGTLLTRVLDPVTVKDILGHADLKTTERYLHAIRASQLADVATRAFSPLPRSTAMPTRLPAVDKLSL